MRRNQILGSVFCSLVGTVVATACGDDGEKGGGGSFSSIADSISSPTGTLSSDNAMQVASEFEVLAESGVSGRRVMAQQSTTVPCTFGGDISVTASGNQNSGTAKASYNSCCFAEGCCLNGGADMYYSANAAESEYSVCGDYDITGECYDTTVDTQFSMCLGSNGMGVYVIEIDGESFAVSGNYNGGSGTLEINAANGSFTCTFTNSAGTCTNADGDDITF